MLTTTDILSTNLVSNLESVDWIDADRLLIQISQNYSVIDTTKENYPILPFIAEKVLTKYGRVITWSPSYDRQYIAMAFDEKKRGRYRHSQYANYKIARIPPTSSDEGNQVYENFAPNGSKDELLELFRWNPKSNAFVFVHENDIYYCDSPESEVTHRITNSSDRFIYNGISDWIYEEEIFSTNAALWWSKSGQYLAYASIDDRNVTKIEYSVFERLQYPFTNRIPYPKTGAEYLPNISLWIFDRLQKKSRQMKIVLKDKSYSAYLFSTSWLRIRNQDMLVAVFSNRYQNYVSITICTFESSKCILNYDQPFNIRGRHLWAEPDDFRIRLSAKDSYFVKLPNLASDGNIYNHIARITVPNDTENEASAVCLTCDRFPNCSAQEVTFSEDNNKFVVTCRGPGIQRFFLSSIASNVSILKEFGDYNELNDRLSAKLLPRRHFENITLTNGYEALIELVLPPELDYDGIDEKYPAIISVYGGPGSQKVSEEFTPNSIDVLLGTRYVIVFIDARGSGMRGWKYKQPLLGKFGTVEVDDQIDAIRILTNKHRFIDPTRVAIWGWSYGGFVAAQAIERDDNGTFKCAVSVAPVTNFKLYDATYTERYMGEEASTDDYEKTDLTQNVTKFKNIQYLIVHGTADDNVHLQNTIQFIRTLEEQNIHFQLMIYPDGTHGLLWARFHLYTLLLEFFRKCFQ